MTAGMTLRPARPEEGATGGRLIYLSGPRLFDYALDLSLGAGQQLLAEMWPLPAHLFSYQWGHVAVASGATQGLLVAYPGSAILGAGWATARLFGRRFPLLRLASMARRAWPLERLSARVPRRDYFIAHLAVLPEARGQGIGTQLLDLADCLARERGCGRCALDVLEGNERARALYERHGYAMERAAHDGRLASIGCSGVLRMVKALNGDVRAGQK
jgi:ribosomal protein S18 acetylase RimI-like enzyme